MAKSLPTIAVYARAVGFMQWMCPHCYELFSSHQIPWRRARIKCTFCSRVYRIGISFNDNLLALPPFTALYGGNWNGYTANRVGECPTFLPAIGRLSGRLDWSCPICCSPQSGYINRDTMSIECLVCSAFFYLRMIFYKSLPGATIKCPLDWSVPKYEPFEDSINPVASSSDGKI